MVLCDAYFYVFPERIGDRLFFYNVMIEAREPSIRFRELPFQVRGIAQGKTSGSSNIP